MQRPNVLWTIVLILLLVTGCSDPSARTPTPASPTIPTRTPAPDAAVGDNGTAVEPTPAPKTIRLWTGTAVSPYGDTAAHTLLNEQLDTYRAAHPDTQIEVHVKNLSGPGSILNYLRTGLTVAPGLMPDVILLPSEQLLTFKTENLIAPLSIEGSDIDNWYPAAVDLAVIEGDVYAWPFVFTNLHHLVWNTAAMTETIPVDWASFVQMENASLAFSAETNAAVALPLHLYRSTGSSPLDSNGVLAPTQPVTTAVYELLQNGQLRDLFAVDPAILTTDEQVLQAVVGNGVAMGVVAAETMLALDPEVVVGYDAIPGESELAPPLVSALSWAVTAQTESRQALANDLIAFLTADDNLGAWSEAAQRLPNSAGALATWQNSAYAQFIDTQLEGAIGYPYYDSSRSRTLAEVTAAFVTTQQSPRAATDSLLARLENSR